MLSLKRLKESEGVHANAISTTPRFTSQPAAETSRINGQVWGLGFGVTV